jgi:hypothetical protein
MDNNLLNAFAKGYGDAEELTDLQQQSIRQHIEDTEDRPKASISMNRAASEFDDTVAGMLSADYKERFKAEYRQTKIRYDKLHKMLVKADAGTLEFNLTCPLELLKDQKMHMGRYLYCLEVRAQIEGIEL